MRSLRDLGAVAVGVLVRVQEQQLLVGGQRPELRRNPRWSGPFGARGSRLARVRGDSGRRESMCCVVCVVCVVLGGLAHLGRHQLLGGVARQAHLGR